MAEQGITLLLIGILLLCGLLLHALGQKTRIPRVTLLLLFGLLIGPSFLDLLPDMSKKWFPLVGNMALVMVGFLLGGKLTRSSIGPIGKLVVFISVCKVLGAALVVTLGLKLAGVSWPIALLLGGIAPATAPAATLDIIRESRSDGPFSRLIQVVVAIDDALGLMVFSFLFVLAHLAMGHEAGSGPFLYAVREIGGALLLGLLLGLPMAHLTGRIKPGEPIMLEALGTVFLCGGLAVIGEVSYLLAAMTMGCVVANLASHHDRPFHAIENIEQPFLVIFFVLAGASLEVDHIATIGVVGSTYVVMRIIGLICGASLGAWLGKAENDVRRWIGMGLLPQAGVALGMALVSAEKFPTLADTILSVVIGATVIFEVLGPICTRIALYKVGELNQAEADA